MMKEGRMERGGRDVNKDVRHCLSPYSATHGVGNC
jgi:hypothetical protein